MRNSKICSAEVRLWQSHLRLTHQRSSDATSKFLRFCNAWQRLDNLRAIRKLTSSLDLARLLQARSTFPACSSALPNCSSWWHLIPS